MLLLEEKVKDMTELSVPAKANYISVVRLCVAGIADRMKFSVDDIEDVKIAVGEACINSIKHGYDNKSDPDHVIRIRFLIHPDKLVVFVKDNGKGFDTALVEAYIRQKGPSQKRADHIGMGVYLIKTLMDHSEFKSNPQSTQVEMIKNCNRSASSMS